MKYHLKNWQKISEDPWILETVSGYRINFDEQPCQEKLPNKILFTPDQWVIVDNEVKTLLKKGAIVKSFHEPDEFISNLFIVSKPNGKFRPVLNLRYLNEFVHYDHFKQETFKVVLDLVQENDYLTSIDLQDAYFAIPIRVQDQKYLKIFWDGMLYTFVCVPFGLKSAPFLFTKVLKPVYANFRQQNIRCSYYIDDSLNMNRDKVVCQNNTMIMTDTLHSLGFTVNLNKSVLIPTQRIVFFGFILDSVQFKVFLTEDKIQKIITKAKSLLESDVIIVRDLASFIGLIINACYAILEAPMHYRWLERNKLAGLGPEINFDNEVILSKRSKQELNWWFHNVQLKNGKRIRPEKAQIHCRTDSSLEGWGSIDLDSNIHANGRWNVHESCNSINFLELLAIFYALQALYCNEHDVHIEIQSDNVSAIKYINDMGGIASEIMDLLAKDIWEWCIERKIHIYATYVPGILNTADFFSRHFSDNTEWMLKRRIFDRICRQFFVPDIDLFASRLNKQLDSFVSWFPEPGALQYNAFTISWQGYNAYIFPPFNLVGKVINKIIQDKVDRAILIFPYWRSQPWFPLLLDNVCSYPVRLPCHKDLLVLPHNQSPHPMGRSLRIIAVVVSGRRYNVEAFHRQLQTSFSIHGRKAQENSIIMPGRNGWFGTVSGLTIPFKRLKL